MQRRQFIRTSAIAALWPQIRAAESPERAFDEPLIPAPDNPAEWPAFREALTRWREDTRKKLRYDDSLYRRPDFNWVPSSFACCFLMLCDEKFYNHAQGRYEVEGWMEEGIREFGGYDSIVFWHAYPRIGLDQRNQFDFYRDMPGGLAGLRSATRAFQSRGVRVYTDYNPWDTGTRREGVEDLDAVVATVKEIGADGIFLDTMERGAAEFRAKLDGARRGVVLEGEGALPLENVHDHHMSWAQGFRDSRVPGVLRNKWLERRHMQHEIWRWNHDHTGELHTAWMNGSGVMVWENVFGSWVGWRARDRSILRSMLPIQRRFHHVFSGEGWTPLIPVGMPDVYASEWEAGGLRLWTVVNRAKETREGTVLSVPRRAGERCFDLMRGQELGKGEAGGEMELGGSIRPRGIACFLAAPASSLPADFAAFLKGQAELYARADLRTEVPERTVSLRPVQPAGRRTAPADMAAIPAQTFEMTVEYRIRETGFYSGQEYVPGSGYNPPDGPQMFHKLHRVSRKVSLKPYAIDTTPVTNAQFAGFLKSSGYKPRDPANFLKHWRSGSVPAELEDHPVVYVGLEDARAYTEWAGKRLPTEEEWQFAAQGPDLLRYPWGNEIRARICNTGETGGTTPVRAFPAGRSPFGCYDMCGNVWEWTESERSDGRTRFVMIRGGSYFRATGSEWYMDGGAQPGNFAAKFLLMGPSLDRCATVGFRCAAELERT